MPQGGPRSSDRAATIWQDKITMTTFQKHGRKPQAELKFEALLSEGLASGPPGEATPEYWQGLRTEAEARIATRRPSSG
jgi:hypothetical protein